VKQLVGRFWSSLARRASTGPRPGPPPGHLLKERAIASDASRALLGFLQGPSMHRSRTRTTSSSRSRFLPGSSAGACVRFVHSPFSPELWHAPLRPSARVGQQRAGTAREATSPPLARWVP
jgi:hypothetical protein